MRQAFGPSFHCASRAALFEFHRDVLGMLLMTLKDFQPGREQILELLVAGRWISVFCSAALTVL
jgi:hypothetical protein